MNDSVEKTRSNKTNRLNPANRLGELSASERNEVSQQTRPNAPLIHETIRAEGEAELSRSTSALLLSGLAAGLSMGFSLLTEALLLSRLPQADWAELISRFGYTIGFLIVVLGRQQLFTENTLTVILPLLYHKTPNVLFRVMRLWALVLIANVLGTWAIAVILAHLSMFTPEVTSAFVKIGQSTVSHSFSETLAMAGFAGWLIALMVWLLPASGDARPFIIIIITYVVALGAFNHIIAGSVDAAYLVTSGHIPMSDYFIDFFIPTLLGNVLGGVSMVAVLNYGQVAPEL